MSQPCGDEAGFEAAAGELCTSLVVAIRAGLGEPIGHAAAKLIEHGDKTLLTSVLANLLTYILSLERRAVEAHGPLMTPEEMGFEEMTPETWQVGVQDQILAAAADQDFQQVARLAVDGQIRCAAQDVGRYDWEAILRSMMLVEQNNLVLVATEALHRLIAQEVSEEG